MHNVLIALTGGGTAGHVNPHFALIPTMRQQGWDVFYVGSSGIERSLVSKFGGVTFYVIAAGKLRRYFDFRNFLDLARIVFGFVQCLGLFVWRRPSLVFSKGGFVSVPVAWAGWVLGIPVVTHESDVTPGLATKLITPFAKRVLHTFPETADCLPRSKARQVGTPIREELLQGDRLEGLKLCGFDPKEDFPTILVMGGSQGALRINQCLAAALPSLCKSYRVIHLSGKGKGIPFSHPRYRSFEYVLDELKHLYAATDLVVSRAGANAIFEFAALKKPMLLIPLQVGSRGDQVKNAESFAKKGWAIILSEAEITSDILAAGIDELKQQAAGIVKGLEVWTAYDAVKMIMTELRECLPLQQMPQSLSD